MLNETQSKNTEKTKSAPKNSYIFWVVILSTLLALIAVGYIFGIKKLNFGCSLRLENKACVGLEQVTEPKDRAIGLAKYDSLPEDRGMLFVFDQPNQACIWMKDMKFSIDIIWLNENKKVIKIERNVAPETYPESFCPEGSAKYVIELSNGVADKANISIGQQINI